MNNIQDKPVNKNETFKNIQLHQNQSNESVLNENKFSPYMKIKSKKQYKSAFYINEVMSNEEKTTCKSSSFQWLLSYKYYIIGTYIINRHNQCKYG